MVKEKTGWRVEVRHENGMEWGAEIDSFSAGLRLIADNYVDMGESRPVKIVFSYGEGESRQVIDYLPASQEEIENQA